MKAIQVMFDESLLARLDASEEVRREGRSAVLRRVVAEYLRCRRDDEIRRQYRKAYEDAAGIDGELAGWAEEAEWAKE